MKTTEGSTDSETTETRLGDGGVNDTLVTEAVEKTLGHLVGTVVLGNLLSENEDLLVLLELLSESLVERISDGVLLDAGAVVGVGSGLGGTENNGSRKSSAGDGRLSSRRSNGSTDSSSRSSEASCGSKNARHDVRLLNSQLTQSRVEDGRLSTRTREGNVKGKKLQRTSFS
jgi:hypothetical protein